MPLTYARHLRTNGQSWPVVVRLILLGLVTALVVGFVQLWLAPLLGA